MKEAVAEQKIRRYWSWAAVSLFLLIPADMLTTIYAAHLYGTAFEANPLMRWSLNQGLPTFVVANLLALTFSGICFYYLMEAFRNCDPPWDTRMRYVIEAWLGVLFGSGLFLVSNNLCAIILGESLLSLIL